MADALCQHYTIPPKFATYEVNGIKTNKIWRRKLHDEHGTFYEIWQTEPRMLIFWLNQEIFSSKKSWYHYSQTANMRGWADINVSKRQLAAANRAMSVLKTATINNRADVCVLQNYN
jgi:hypothetical protein